MMFVSENGIYIFLEYLVIIIILLKLFAKLTQGISKSNTCLVGKTVIITGGNSGLGYQTALCLAGRGAKVIIADKDDSAETKRKIIECTNNRNIICKHLDLSSFTSVRKFANEINQEESRLDILINNAGSTGFANVFTEDGLPLGIQVNFFGAFLLTHLLIDLMKRSAPSRIIFVSSLLAFTNNLTLGNLNEIPRMPTKFLQELMTYGNSKIMNIIASNIFGEKLKGSGVTSNSLHPGMVKNTQIFNKFRAANISSRLLEMLMFDIIVWFFGKSLWEGAQTHMYCALSKNLENVTGKYFVDCRPFPQPMKVCKKDLCLNLWKKSEDIVKLTDTEKL